MYKVVFCRKKHFFEEYGEEQEALVTKDELIQMLRDSKTIVFKCEYIGTV